MNTREFLDAYQGLEHKLYAFAMKLTRNSADADDLMQETAVRAYSNRDKFQMGTNFKSWTTTIMRNTFINRYRMKRRRNLVDGPLEDHTYAIESNTVSNGSESVMMMQELRKILDQIKPKYRIPFLMHYQGYEYQEIAKEMNIPIGTVKSRLYTARQQLTKLIQANYQEERLMRA
ncbi:MAG: RNA polymerase sigma factor [Bacteroidota bacterium]